MVVSLNRSTVIRWALAASLGPLTGPLALRALACAREGDQLGAWAYAATIPAVWVHLSLVAAAPWLS
jgi:hypothetical protein